MAEYPALAVQPGNFVGNFLAGMGQSEELRNAKVRNKLLEDEQAARAQAMQRDEQFRNILAQTVGPMAAQSAQAPQGLPPGMIPGMPGIPGGGAPQGPPDGGVSNYLMQSTANPLASGPTPEQFNQLVQLDPERAYQFAQQFEAQRQQQAAEMRERAGTAVRAAQFVQRSKDPKRTLEIGFPDMVEQLEAQGIRLEELDDDAVRAMADDVIAQFGPIAGMGPAGGGDPFTLSQGQKRFDAEGNEIASVDAAPTDNDPNDKSFQRETTLRKEYENRREGFETIRSAFQNVENAEPNDAGDTQLVLNYMRVISPGVRVQPGERIEDAASVPGVPQAAIGLWNKIVGGGKLNDSQRKEIRGQARKTFDTQEKLAREARTRYSKLAEEAGLSPWRVVGDDTSAPREPGGGGGGGGGARTPAPAAALDYLRAHPEAREQFRQKYGYVP